MWGHVGTAYIFEVRDLDINTQHFSYITGQFTFMNNTSTKNIRGLKLHRSLPEKWWSFLFFQLYLYRSN